MRVSVTVLSLLVAPSLPTLPSVSRPGLMCLLQNPEAQTVLGGRAESACSIPGATAMGRRDTDHTPSAGLAPGDVKPRENVQRPGTSQGLMPASPLASQTGLV